MTDKEPKDQKPKKRRMDIPRQEMPEQPPEERRANFKEVPLGFSEETARKEAERCIQCKKPKCVKGCPVSIKIPEFIKFIEEGDFAAAAAKLKEDNALPAVCGRVCPQEEQCEVLCVLGTKYEPVSVGRLERFVADWEMASGKINLPEIKSTTGKAVAIVGSGPAGLACAGDLIQKGHRVTVFEALHKLGGVLVYGIPEFRLPKAILDYEVGNLTKMGVEFVPNSPIGKTDTIQELLDSDFDAVFVGSGAGLPVFMRIPGESLSGVYSANEFLTRSNLMKAYLFPKYDTPIQVGKRVAVIGGGNTAMDAVRTSIRLGAEEAMIIYRRSRKEMPARNEEIHHAEEEGVQFHMLTAPIRYIGDDNGKLVAAECIKMELGEPDASGRRRPVPMDGSEYTVELDTAVVAIGNGANPLIPQTTPELEVNKWGNIVATESNGKTSMEGVWAGGDIVRGGATVILAMGDGRNAATSIHKYLMGEEDFFAPPTEKDEEEKAAEGVA